MRSTATLEVCAKRDGVVGYESIALVLRATSDANIRLVGGVPLASVDVHFTLSTRWRTPGELDRDLGPEDVGFLAHNLGPRNEPTVHGASVIVSSPIAAVVANCSTQSYLELSLPTVPFSDDPNAPYVWGLQRDHMLRVSRLELKVMSSEVETNARQRVG